LYRTDLITFPPYPPDNHHCADDVYLKEGGAPPSLFAYVELTRS